MKHISLFSKMRLLFAMGVSLAVFSTGCVREHMDACPDGNCELVLKVVNENYDEITGAGDVTEASIYLFDENQNYLATHQLEEIDIAGYKRISLNYPEGKKIYAIAWGNANRSSEQTITKGDKMEDLKVKINRQNETLLFPDSLFHGQELILIKNNSTVPDTVTIEPKTGSINLFTQDLPEKYKAGLRADEAPCDMSVQQALNEFDYKGDLIGESSDYEPEAEWTVRADQDEWETGRRSMVAENNELAASLKTRIDGEVLTRTHDIEGEPIVIHPRTNTDVIFMWDEEGNFIGIQVKVRPWGYKDDDIEW